MMCTIQLIHFLCGPEPVLLQENVRKIPGQFLDVSACIPPSFFQVTIASLLRVYFSKMSSLWSLWSASCSYPSSSASSQWWSGVWDDRRFGAWLSAPSLWLSGGPRHDHRHLRDDHQDHHTSSGFQNLITINIVKNKHHPQSPIGWSR